MPPQTFVAERDPSAPLLDVRTPGEFAGGHLAGGEETNFQFVDYEAVAGRF